MFQVSGFKVSRFPGFRFLVDRSVWLSRRFSAKLTTFHVVCHTERSAVSEQGLLGSVFEPDGSKNTNQGQRW